MDSAIYVMNQIGACVMTCDYTPDEVGFVGCRRRDDPILTDVLASRSTCG